MNDPLDVLAAKYVAPESIPEIDDWPCGCEGRGWVVDLTTRVARPCSCRALKPIEERIVLAGMTDKANAGATWEAREVPHYPSREGLSQFPMPKPVVTLLGPVGTGKGYTAVCILRDWLLAGKRCRWIEVPEFIEQLLAEPMEDREPDIQALFLPDLLILDEVYSQRSMPYGDEVVSRIIRRRLADWKALVLVSNFAKADMEKVEARIASRIFGSSALVFDFEGLPDRRRTSTARERRDLGE